MKLERLHMCVLFAYLCVCVFVGHCSEPFHLLGDCHKIVFLACLSVNVFTPTLVRILVR
jgi:hypothetical protein